MKTFDEILDEVDIEMGGCDPIEINYMRKWAKEANRRYTTAAIKEHLSRAAENARLRPIPYYTGPDDAFEVDRESITNIEIKIV